jgi:PIN domain nuclease of toxin-antitoxin system
VGEAGSDGGVEPGTHVLNEREVALNRLEVPTAAQDERLVERRFQPVVSLPTTPSNSAGRRRTARSEQVDHGHDPGHNGPVDTSIWEIGIKVKRRRIELPIPVEEFARRIERGRVVELLPVDTSTWLRSLSLDWEHSDPADRVIVATALIRGVPLLTKNATIHAFGEITCVW